MFRALYKNEMIKLFRRKGTIVIICIIAAFTLLFSVAYSSGGYSLDPDDCSTELMRENCIRARDAGVTKDDWRYAPYTAIQSDAYSKRFNNNNVHYVTGEDDDLAVPENYVIYNGADKEDDSTVSEYVKKQWKYIDDNDSAAFFSDMQKDISNAASDSRKSIEDILKRVDAVAMTDEEAELFTRIKAELERAFSYSKDIYNFDSAGIPGKYTFYNVLSEATTAVGKISYVHIQSKDEYNGQSDSFSIADALTASGNGANDDVKKYSEYLEEKLDDIQAISESLVIYAYSLEHGVVDTVTANSSRNALLEVFGLAFSAAAVFGVFLAGASVSSEFSRKTINMLVIRPASRTKILLSKLMACLTAVYSAIIAGVFVYWLARGFITGFSDYFQPYLWYDGTTVKSCAFGLWFIGRCALASFGTVAYTILAFMLSIITKSTPVSTVLPMLWYALGSVANSLVIGICGKLNILGAVPYLPSMYSNLWEMATDGIFTPGAGEFDIAAILNLNKTIVVSAGADLLHGAIVLPVFTIVIAVIGFVTFAKRDIK